MDITKDFKDKINKCNYINGNIILFKQFIYIKSVSNFSCF